MEIIEKTHEIFPFIIVSLINYALTAAITFNTNWYKVPNGWLLTELVCDEVCVPGNTCKSLKNPIVISSLIINIIASNKLIA